MSEELTQPVETDAGLICGLRDGGVASFKGVPFAAPPVGDLRWRKPQPVQPWSRPLIADRYGPACIQPLLPGDALMRQFSFAAPPECGMSEDCLYLNVWTPDSFSPAARLPVIVWIYGGGQRVGAGSHPVSDGANLARQGAVVVSLNYRLGALGFLAHPALAEESGFAGNYACHDVLAALHWVQRNIAAFGGDPDCVTIFGQSAGAAIVSILLASPLSAGLFHRAISHSGGRFHGGPMGHLKTAVAAQADGERFMQEFGATDLRVMRNLPADALFGARGMWSFIQDGELLPAPVSSLFEHGRQMQVPVLAGYTANETAAYGQAEQYTSSGFTAHVHHSFGAQAQRVLAEYPHQTDAQAKASSFALRRDSAFAYQAWRTARSQSAEVGTYLFAFLQALPLAADFHVHEQAPQGGFGAYHGAELWYVFNNLDRLQADWSKADIALAETMGHYWLNFARTGDPNGEGLVPWPSFRNETPLAMDFGPSMAVEAPFNLRAFRLFDEIYQTTK